MKLTLAQFAASQCDERQGHHRQRLTQLCRPRLDEGAQLVGQQAAQDEDLGAVCLTCNSDLIDQISLIRSR